MKIIKKMIDKYDVPYKVTLDKDLIIEPINKKNSIGN